MHSLTGKTAIVTGGSKGIGAAIALGMAHAGANVIINYASDLEGAHRVATRIWSLSGNAAVVQGNVSSPSDVEVLFRKAEEEFGTPSVLVNNAGVYSFSSLADVTPEEYRRQFDVNVLGTLLTTRQALKHFPQSGGSVVNITSIASFSAMPNSSIYSASKAAIEQITRSLAKELGPRHIRVNAVAPGMTLTEGLRTGMQPDNDMEKMVLANTPLGRLGAPEDIVPAVVFLASDASHWITGERLAVSGGLRF